jgi:hypothetical protein
VRTDVGRNRTAYRMRSPCRKLERGERREVGPV